MTASESKRTIVIYQEDNGRVPFLKWFEALIDKQQDKCLARLELLKAEGHKLDRPAAALLRDGIYELRAKHQRVNLRILYFFHGQDVVVLSHGLTKQQAKVQSEEIDRALKRKEKFEKNPKKHTYREPSS